MLNNLVVGRYYRTSSKIHSMHPLSKIICTIFFIIMVFVCNNIKLMLVLSLLAVLFTEMAHVPHNIYYKTIMSLKYIILFIIIINLLFKVDYIIIIITILRLVLIVLYTSILTLTTPPTEITYGLEMFLSPLRVIKVPVSKIALSISLAIRFVPTIIDQGNKILKSQASRGIDYYNSSISGKFMAIKSMIIPMFVLTIKRADDLADAMAVRLYNVDDKRTNFRINKWHVFDTYMLAIHFIITALIVYNSF